MAPTQQQISTMAKQWAEIDKKKFTNVMYHKMFEAHPEWLPLFKKFETPFNDNDQAFHKQVAATEGGLNKVVQMARDGQMDTMEKYLHDMAKRHVGYKVDQTHFQALKPIIEATVTEQVPGADKDAWTATLCYVLDNIVPV